MLLSGCARSGRRQRCSRQRPCICDLNSVLPQADVVVLTCPLTRETENRSTPTLSAE
jgi:phosphoglycerate dehydrogenase-like enzyme